MDKQQRTAAWVESMAKALTKELSGKSEPYQKLFQAEFLRDFSPELQQAILDKAALLSTKSLAMPTESTTDS